MSVMFLLGWGYWYLSCSILWTLSGFVWMWRPSIGARVSVFPVLGIAALMTPLFLPPYRGHLEWSPIFWFYGSQILCLAVALALITATIRKTSVPNFTPWIVSFTLVFGSFLVDRAFVDRHSIKSCRMYVALDAKSSSGLADPGWGGPDAVLLYRTGRNGVVCWDFFRSKELHDFLSAKNGQPVTVEYETFSDFWKIRGYNVRSVDGKMLASGYHVLKPEFAGSSGVTAFGGGGSGNLTASEEDCW